MTRTWTFAAVTAASALIGVAGCENKDTNPPKTYPPPGTSGAAQGIQQGLRQAWDATRQFTYEQRDTMFDAAQRHLDQVQQNLIDLRAKAEASPKDTRSEWVDIEKNLQGKLDDARDELNKARSAQRDNWNDAVSHLNDAMKRLSEGLQTAQAKFGQR